MRKLRCNELMAVSGGTENPIGFVCFEGDIPIYGVFAVSTGFCITTSSNFYVYAGGSLGAGLPVSMNIATTSQENGFLTELSFTASTPGIATTPGVFAGTNLTLDAFAGGRHIGIDASISATYGVQVTSQSGLSNVNTVGCFLQNGTIRVDPVTGSPEINTQGFLTDLFGGQASNMFQCLNSTQGQQYLTQLASTLTGIPVTSGQTTPTPGVIISGTTYQSTNSSGATTQTTNVTVNGAYPDGTPYSELGQIVVDGTRTTTTNTIDNVTVSGTHYVDYNGNQITFQEWANPNTSSFGAGPASLSTQWQNPSGDIFCGSGPQIDVPNLPPELVLMVELYSLLGLLPFQSDVPATPAPAPAPAPEEPPPDPANDPYYYDPYISGYSGYGCP